MRWILFVLSASSVGCAVDEVGATADESTGDTAGDSGDDGEEALWDPATVYPSPAEPGARGFLDRRGLIHTHSIYSHDACDEMPMTAMGEFDTQCEADLRNGICAVQHDFVMFTDHRESYTDYEYPDVLVYRPDWGDELVTRGGVDTANWASCGDENAPVLVMAGCEGPGSIMPVGLEGHLADTPSERSAILGDLTQANADLVHQKGGIVLLAHTESNTPQALIDLPIDGFEAYNIHANLFANLGEALALLDLIDTPEMLPHSDLILAPLFSEEPTYIDTWGTVMARGAKRIVTLGTDSHRNTFPQLLPDGERVDSFRRLMKWFSNHILVRPAGDGTWNDVELKDGLRAGRLYGAFEFLGYPEGFDAHMTGAAGPWEIGETVGLADAPRLQVTMPAVRGLDPDGEVPELEIRVLRAIEGGWESMFSSGVDLEDFAIDDVGVYRVEVRIVPKHVRQWLGPLYGDLADADFPWIYANPFYVE